jgi:hypothetical protein
MGVKTELYLLPLRIQTMCQALMMMSEQGWRSCCSEFVLGICVFSLFLPYGKCSQGHMKIHFRLGAPLRCKVCQESLDYADFVRYLAFFMTLLQSQ